MRDNVIALIDFAVPAQGNRQGDQERDAAPVNIVLVYVRVRGGGRGEGGGRDMITLPVIGAGVSLSWHGSMD